MSLFTKKIDDVKFDDVKTFFERKLREGLRIDYKVDFPKDLAKIVIAFANTAGGLVLFGIRANKETNTPEEIVGVPLREGLEEQVTDITMSNIRPSVSPEVKVCPFKSQDNLNEDDKAVVVVRVSESELAPHSDARTNMIWVRNHNRCDLASLETIEQLLARRDEGVEIREEILQETPGLTYKGIEAVCPQKQGPKRYYEIFISPLYPVRTMTFDKATDNFLLGQIESVEHVNIQTPRIGGINFECVSPHENVTSSYFIVTRNALIIGIWPLELAESGGVYIERVIQLLAKMLRAAGNILERFEYFGQVSVKVTVGGVGQLKFQSLVEGTRFGEGSRCQDLNIELEELRSLDEIRDSETEILYSFYNNLLRSFKMSEEPGILRARLDWLLGHLP